MMKFLKISFIVFLLTISAFAVPRIEEMDYNNAVALFNKADYDYALDAARRYSEKYPQGAYITEINIMIGEIHLQKEEFERSEEYFLKALSSAKGKNEPKAVYGLARLFYSSRQFDKAKDNYVKLTKTDGYAEEAYLKTAVCMYYLNRRKEAEQYLKEFLLNYRDSKHVNEARYYLGLVYVKSNEFEKAVKTLETAADGDDEYKYYSLYALANIFHERKDLSTALSYIRKFDGLEDNDIKASAYFLRANIYFAQNKINEAVTQLSGISNLRTSLADYALFTLGGFYYENNEFSKALSVYDSLLARFPLSAYALESVLQKALCLMETGKYDEARRGFREAFSYKDHSPDKSVYFIAKTYFLQENFNEAVSTLNDFIKTYPDSDYLKEAFYLNALSNFHLKNYEEAAVNFEKTGLKDKLSEGKYYLARSYFYTGDYTRAEMIFREILRDSKDEKIKEYSKHWLGNTLLAQYRFADAYNVYTEYLNEYKDGNLKYETYYKIGEYYFYIDNYHRALKNYEVALRSDDKELRLKTNVSVLKYLYATEKYGDLIKTADELKINADNPLMWDVYNLKASSYYYLREYDKAEEYLDKIINSDNPDAAKFLKDALLLKGKCFYFKKKNESAVKIFNKLLITPPLDPEFRAYSQYWLSKTLFNSEKYNVSIDVAKNLLSQQPDIHFKEEVIFMIAQNYLSLRDYKNAAHFYNLSSRSKTARTKILSFYKLGLSLINLHEYARAVQVLNTAAQIADGRVKILSLFALGRAYFLNADYEKAAGVFSNFNVEKTETLYYESVYWLAESYFKLNRFNDAVSSYEILREAASSFQEEAVYKTGDAYFNMENYDKAITFYAELKKTFPSSPLAAQANLNIAECYIKKDETSFALKEYEKFVLENPKSPMLKEVFLKIAGITYEKQEFQKSADAASRLIAASEEKHYLNSGYDFLIKSLSKLNDSARLTETYGEVQKRAPAILTPEILFIFETAFFRENDFNKSLQILKEIEKKSDDERQSELVRLFKIRNFYASKKLKEADALLVLAEKSRFQDIASKAFYYSAVINYEKGDYEKSLKKCENYINNFQIFEDYERMLFLTLSNLYKLEKYDKIVKNYDSLKNSAYPENLKDDFYRMLAESFLFSDENKKSSELYSEIKNKKQQDNYNLALAEFKLKNYEKSLSSLKNAPAGFLKAENLKINNYIELNDINSAYSVLIESGRLKELLPAAFKTAALLINSEELKKAENLILKINENDISQNEKDEFYYLKGHLYYKLKDYKQAAENLKKTKKENAPFLTALSLINMGGRGNYEESIEYLKNSKNTQAPFYAAVSYFNIENYEQAAGLLKNYSPLKDQEIFYNKIMGMALAETGNIKEAGKYLTEYEKKEKNISAAANYYLGVFYYETHPDKALLYLNKAVEQGETEEIIKATLKKGDLYFKFNEITAARLEYLKVINLYENPVYIPEALYKLALCEMKLNDTEKAADFLNEIIKNHAESEYNKKALELKNEIGNN